MAIVWFAEGYHCFWMAPFVGCLDPQAKMSASSLGSSTSIKTWIRLPRLRGKKNTVCNEGRNLGKWNNISPTWYPQNGCFIREIPIKMDDLGVPLFLETPIFHQPGFS